MVTLGIQCLNVDPQGTAAVALYSQILQGNVGDRFMFIPDVELHFFVFVKYFLANISLEALFVNLSS